MMKKTAAVLVTIVLVFSTCLLVTAEAGREAAEAFHPDSPYKPGEVIVLIKESNLADKDVESSLQSRIQSGFTVKRLYEGELQAKQGSYRKRLLLLSFDPETDVRAVSEQLMQDSLVEIAEPNYIGQVQHVPNDFYFVSQWAPKKIGLEQGYDITMGTPEIVIALVDSGVDQDHPDLIQKLYPGYDFVNEDNNPEDDYGHGTRMAGIIGAMTDNTIGVAGTCPNCRIVPIKAANSGGYLGTYDVYQSLQYAMNLHTLEGIPDNPHPAQIISMSFVFEFSNGFLTSAVQEASAAGAILVAAAGNDGNDIPVYPAAYPEVIAVAMTNQYDMRVGTSNYGDWVDIAAPGYALWTTNYYNGYSTSTGTSPAAAMVSGVVGLMLSRNPDLDQAQIVQILQGTAAPVTGFPAIGGGRIDAFHSLIQSHDAPVLLHLDNVTVSEASTVIIIAEGIDATNDPLTFTSNDERFQVYPLPAVGEVQKAKFQWYADYQSAGTYTVEITVSDSGIYLDSQTLTLTVLDRPVPREKRLIMPDGLG